jgi:hypothetical protein
VADGNLLVVRRLEPGQPLPVGCREALLVFTVPSAESPSATSLKSS